MPFNFPCVQGSFCQIASTLGVFLRPYVNFSQLSVHPWDLPSTSVYFPCVPRTIRQLSVHQQDLLSTSAHFPCGCGSFCQIPSTFCSCGGHSVIIQCVRGTFHPIPSTSVKVLCLWDLQKTFRVATGHSVNFRQPSVRPRNNLLKFCASVGPSVKVCAFPCSRRNFRRLSVHLWDLLSTFPTSTGPSINFCHLSVHLRDHPSTFFVIFLCVLRIFIQLSVGHFINFPCVCGTFINTIRASAGPSVNLCQLSVHPWDLPSTFRVSVEILSTSINFSCTRRILRQHSIWQRDLPSTSLNFPAHLWDMP